MCEHCKHLGQHLETVLHGHISSLIDAFSIASNAEWELSEPMLVGGAPGVYEVNAPFVGDCQWRCDNATAGATATQILISSSTLQNLTVADYTGSSGKQFNGRSTLDALAVFVPASNSIPVDSEWYNVRNDQNLLYVLFTAASNGAFCNLVFRQKRMVKK